MRNDHPIVRRYLRKPILMRVNLLILCSVIGLFLLLGGLSLPILYFLFSLVVLIQIAVTTADKIHDERAGFTWDLMRITPFTRSEVLLSMWAASIRQLNRSWIMYVYRLLQGLIVIGLMVFSMLFAEIPMHQWILVLLTGTMVIVLQPFAELYFSGMVGLLSANLIQDRVNAQGFAVVTVLTYWLAWIVAALVVILANLDHLDFTHIATVLILPLLLPLALGYGAFLIAKIRMA
jgi:hypothetical protein